MINELFWVIVGIVFYRGVKKEMKEGELLDKWYELNQRSKK